jgi:acyl-CoA reductase-like NAD-dependent aldehyde dehydrogenase
MIRRWYAILARDAPILAETIRDEIGKPLPEAHMEVTAALDAIRWIVHNAKSTLRNTRLRVSWQRFALMRSARLRWAPLGVVAIIGTWNYPLFLDAPAIASALIAGNGVAWKPSELSLGVADQIRKSLREAELPEGLVSILYGGADVGRALANVPLSKLFFTGGLKGGRAVAENLAQRGVPIVAELSGFDAAIVLPDAPLESTAHALIWASFVGAGQTCVAVKRIFVVGDDRPWISELADRSRALRIGNPAHEVDMGPMISRVARDRFHRSIQNAIEAGAEVVAGGHPIEGEGWFYAPTVLRATTDRPEKVLAGVFGPVVLIRSVRTDDDAIAAANASEFGLAASVWGRDQVRARWIADQLAAGMVTINDAVTPSGLASAPFGGVKASGFGRVRGELGLREFASPQVIHARRPGGYRPHLFPYSEKMLRVFAIYRWLFHRSAR